MMLEAAAIATVVKPVGKKLVEKIVLELVTPKIKEFTTWCGEKYKEKMIPTAEHFQEYLERTYNKLYNINVWSLNNSKRQLKDIYVPQSIFLEYSKRQKKEIRIKVDQLPVQLIKEYKQILITDTAGMGKSTMIRFMFVNLMEMSLKEVGIPIYIELNRLKKNWTILDEIQNQLNSLSKNFDTNLLYKLIQTGGFIFFLDGYDEIPIDDISDVTKNLQDFISKAGENNYYLLTSRPDDRLSSFVGFHQFRICPLKKEEAYELFKNYDISEQKETAGRLIDKLNTADYIPVREYLGNPLLVSLLYAAFEYSPDLPLKKHQFYRQVYDALYKRHDLSKGIDPHEKKSRLDVDDFSRVLRYVGFECLKRGTNSFDKDSILGLISYAKEKYKGLFLFSESNFLDDLLLAVPLFTRDGTEYKWAHKSLMEYFAARYVAEDTKQNQDKYLDAIYKSEHLDRYVNMLDLYFDIDEQGFSKSIMLPLLNDFVQYHDTHWSTHSTISNELIEERIGLCYGSFSLGLTIKQPIDKELNKRLRNYIERNTTENRHHSSHFYGFFQDYMLIRSVKSNPYNRLSNVLARKRPDLFNVVIKDYIKNRNVGFKISKEIKGTYFTVEKVHDIDIMEGCNNDDLFKLINHLLISSQILSGTPYYFKYDSVKQEIDKIKKEIEKYNDTSDLDGI